MKQTWIFALAFVLLVLTGQGDCRRFRTERELLREERDFISWLQSIGLKLTDVVNRLKEHIGSDETLQGCIGTCNSFADSIFPPSVSSWIAGNACEPLCNTTLRTMKETVGKKRSRRLQE